MGRFWKSLLSGVSVMLGALVGWGTSLAGSKPSRAWVWGLLAAILLLGILAGVDAWRSHANKHVKEVETGVEVKAGSGGTANENELFTEKGARIRLFGRRRSHVDKNKVDAGAGAVVIKAGKGGSARNNVIKTK